MSYQLEDDEQLTVSAPARSVRGRWAWIAGLAALIVAVLVVGFLVQSGPTKAAGAARNVLMVDGANDATTSQFAIAQKSWTITYSFDCSSTPGGQGNFGIDVYGPDHKLAAGKTPALVAGQEAESQTVEHGAGTFYLKIASTCLWTVSVVG